MSDRDKEVLAALLGCIAMMLVCAVLIEIAPDWTAILFSAVVLSVCSLSLLGSAQKNKEED